MDDPRLKLFDQRLSLTLQELAEIQSLATLHIAFSLTLACPLRCAHCIVRASPDSSDTTLPLALAKDLAEQMTALAARGIRTVSFTGGEPLLARRQLEVLSESAAQAGLSAGVVTSGYWAKTPQAARRLVQALPAINCWDVSVDRYHQAFVPLEWVRNACEALLAESHRVTVRFTHHSEIGPEEEAILDFVQTLPEVAFTCQRVRTVGRGSTLPIAAVRDRNPWIKPCLTMGMVVRYDGTIAPCCLNLVEARQHPFQFGLVQERPLIDIHRDYLAMPLLQMIRTIGFSQLIAWIEEAGLASRLPASLPGEVCELCTLLMGDPVLSELLTAKTSSPEMQLKIGVLTHHVLGEPHMLGTVLSRMANQAASIAGYDLAWNLLHDGEPASILT